MRKLKLYTKSTFLDTQWKKTNEKPVKVLVHCNFGFCQDSCLHARMAGFRFCFVFGWGKMFFLKTVLHCNPCWPKTYSVTQAYSILLLHIKYWDYKCNSMCLDISGERLNQDLSVAMHTYNLRTFEAKARELKFQCYPGLHREIPSQNRQQQQQKKFQIHVVSRAQKSFFFSPHKHSSKKIMYFK